MVRHCGRGYMALSVVAASLVGLAYSTLASQLVDLSEDFTAETIESMKADMVRRRERYGSTVLPMQDRDVLYG